MFSYSSVESALAKLFMIEPERRTAFRGRLRNLQKLGLAPAAPGSGKRLQYTIFDVCDLALAMSIAEFGADPHEIVLDVPSGTFVKNQKSIWSLERATFVYVPYHFSGLRSETGFYDYSEALNVIDRRPRAALIDVGYIIDLMDTIFSELELNVKSPFDAGEG